MWKSGNKEITSSVGITVDHPSDEWITIELSFDASKLQDKTGSSLVWKVSGWASDGILGEVKLLSTTINIGAVRFYATLFDGPTNFRTTEITANSIALQWDPVDRAESYQVKRDGAVINTGTEPHFLDIGLRDNHTYTYEVSAYDGAKYTSPAALTAKTLGILSISVPSFISFPNIYFKSMTEAVTTQFTSGLYIKNTTEDNMGWHVTVEASQFQEPGGLKLPLASLMLKPPSSIIKSDGTTSDIPESTITSSAVIDNGSAIKIISANKGEGEYKVNFPDDALTLTINLSNLTANHLNKTYQSNLSFSIVQGP